MKVCVERLNEDLAAIRTALSYLDDELTAQQVLAALDNAQQALDAHVKRLGRIRKKASALLDAGNID